MARAGSTESTLTKQHIIPTIKWSMPDSDRSYMVCTEAL